MPSILPADGTSHDGNRNAAADTSFVLCADSRQEYHTYVYSCAVSPARWCSRPCQPAAQSLDNFIHLHNISVYSYIQLHTTAYSCAFPCEDDDRPCSPLLVFWLCGCSILPQDPACSFYFPNLLNLRADQRDGRRLRDRRKPSMGDVVLRRFRQWLSGKSFQFQFEYGLEQLSRYGTIKPAGTGWIFTPYCLPGGYDERGCFQVCKCLHS